VWSERLRSAAGMVLLAGLIGGCGGAESEDQKPGEVALVTETPGELSVTRIGVPYEQRRTLHAAEEKLIQTCMQKAGFSYRIIQLPEKEEKATWKTWRRHDDVDRAAREGYGLLQRAKENNETQRAQARIPSRTAGMSQEESDRFSKALFGSKPITVTTPFGAKITTNVDGCLAEARKQLYGDPAAWAIENDLVGNFEAITFGKARSSPEVRALEKKWSSCMADAGHRFQNQEEAKASITYGRQSGPDQPRTGLPARPSQQEIDLALADARCDQKVGLSTLIEKKIKEKTQEHLNKYQSYFASYQEKQQKALKLAADILG